MWMADGRVADVEVTTCTDGDALGFFQGAVGWWLRQGVASPEAVA